MLSEERTPLPRKQKVYILTVSSLDTYFFANILFCCQGAEFRKTVSIPESKKK